MKPRRPLLRWAMRIAFVVFLVVVAGLLVRAARAIDWNSGCRDRGLRGVP